MHFDQFITRASAANSLPGDSVPTTAPNGVGANTLGPLSFKTSNNSGVPIKAILIGYATAQVGANAVNANVYIWTEPMNAWLLVSANVSLPVNTLTSVTLPAAVVSRLSAPQSVEVFVQLQTTATPTGTYNFGISAGM